MTTYVHHFKVQTMEDSKPLVGETVGTRFPRKICPERSLRENDNIVLWDNTAILHHPTSGGSYASKHRRDMD